MFLAIGWNEQYSEAFQLEFAAPSIILRFLKKGRFADVRLSFL
jgi:hypothetical protein